MFQSLIHRLLLRRHFWRYASFSEIAELYTSRMLRMVAINISATFVSIFLYQHGYSMQFILGYWTVFYCGKVILALPLAGYAAKYGPKHGILLSNLLYIPSMIAFTQVPRFGVIMLVVTGTFQAISAALYNESYLIDFSKVKNAEHAGKELAYMNIFEKVATGLSPLLGGLLAFAAGPIVTMWVAAALFAVAAAPLFRTGEPQETEHRLVFRGFPWRAAFSTVLGNIGVGFDVIASGMVWTLLVAVVIVGVNQDNKVYAVIGGLASLIVVADVVSSYIYGKIIDRKRGGLLLKTGLLIDILTHLTRPFVQTIGTVGGVNIANEAGTTAYMMAYTRGTFDMADRTGHRATYVGLIELMQDLGAALAAGTACLMVVWHGTDRGLREFFFVAAAAVCLVLLARFPLYRR